jgi:hypothetical protein
LTGTLTTGLLTNQLKVTGVLTLGGSSELEVNLTGYVAGTVTATDTIASYASEVGTFASKVYINPSLVNTSAWVYTYGPTAFTDQVNNAP